jgi:uncharacterized protein (TIGR00369 family)
MSPPKAPPPVPFATILGEAQGPLAFIPRAAQSQGDEAGVVWEYQVDPQHFNPYGALHGGVVLALLDTAMGHAVATQVHAAGRFNVAAQMSTSFLAPVYAGLLRARAHVVKIGKRLAVVEARAEHEDGTAVAIATATHTLLP